VSASSLALASRPESVRPAVAFMLKTAKALQIPAAWKPLFEVALSEAVANAVKYGGHANEGVIVCEVERSPRHVIFRISDSGEGFVVPEVTLPYINPDEVQTLPESGYGLPIIQTVFPAVRGVHLNGRFTLELCLPLD
jgi:anti-sigma regulatory factor (Ser/Thr protein kinase)